MQEKARVDPHNLFLMMQQSGQPTFQETHRLLYIWAFMIIFRASFGSILRAAIILHERRGGYISVIKFPSFWVEMVCPVVGNIYDLACMNVIIEGNIYERADKLLKLTQ